MRHHVASPKRPTASRIRPQEERRTHDAGITVVPRAARDALPAGGRWRQRDGDPRGVGDERVGQATSRGPRRRAAAAPGRSAVPATCDGAGHGQARDGASTDNPTVDAHHGARHLGDTHHHHSRPGEFEVSELDLFMPGIWELRLGLSGAVSDKAVVTLKLR